MGQWRRAGPGPQKHPRVSARRPVRISTVHPETDPDTGDSFYRIVEETTADLSRGGAFVESWEPLESGRQVLVEIDLPDGPPLQIVGRVAWTRRQLCASSLRQIGRDPSLEAARRETAEPGRSPTPTSPGPGYGLEFVGGSKANLARLDAHLKSIQSGQDTDAAESSIPAAGSLSPRSSSSAVSSAVSSHESSPSRQGTTSIPRP